MKVGDAIYDIEDEIVIRVGVVRAVERTVTDSYLKADVVSYSRAGGRLLSMSIDSCLDRSKWVVVTPVQATGEPEAERPNEPASPGSPLPEVGASPTGAVILREVKCQEHI